MLVQRATRSFKAALVERKETWAILLGILGAILVCLVVAQIALQAARRKGWTTYQGLDTVSAVAVDSQGRAWAAGYRRDAAALMLHAENENPREVPLPDELARTAPPTLMTDSQDRLWVGTENGIVGMLDIDGEWVLHTSNPDYSVWGMVMDGQGQVWVISHRGPGRIDPRAGASTFAFTNTGLPEDNAVALAVDAEGQLWVLTSKQELKVLEPDGSWRMVTTVPTTVRTAILGSALAFDQHGQIWLATGHGVGVLSPSGAWTEYLLGEPSRSLSMIAIALDAEGRVWVAAADHGLFVFDPQSGWRNYTNLNSGLGSDTSTLALDPQGKVWLGSVHGEVTRFDPDATLPVQNLAAVHTIISAVMPSVVLLAILANAFLRPGPGRGRKLVVFLMAISIWFTIATLLWLYIRYEHAQSGGMFFINPLAVLPPMVNLLMMILVSVWQRRMAPGAFSAFLINWIGLILVRPAVDPFGVAPFWEAVFMIPFFLPQ